jgi:hydroxymethylpyrimidine pyrophosphatase-like HAD family hydrolase
MEERTAHPISAETHDQLRRFVEAHDFFNKGCLALDLDGTALNEDRGRIYIPDSVEAGVKAIHDLNRPVILNTLRFPFSVMNTIGMAWYELADLPIPTVLLNGSILGEIRLLDKKLEYQEITAFPMTGHEISLVIDGISQLLKGSVDEILLFHYARDWREGEAIWTPRPERIGGLRRKFVSATTVKSSSLEQLDAELRSKEFCMMSLFIDRPEDTLMAYQHSKRNSFFTRKGVDKASGLKEMAKRQNLSLADSIGCGDTEMDSFLNEVGLAVIVGGSRLPFKGKFETTLVANPPELGHFISALAHLAKIPA